MINNSFHCHPVPIARSNPLYGELDDQFPYQPQSKHPTEPLSPEQKEILERLNQIREKVAQHNETKKPLIETRLRRDVSGLNRCDVNEVRQFNHILSSTQQRQIHSIRRKIELLPQRYSDPHYLPQSQILLLSHGWPNADRYCCCSIPSSVNPSGQCRLHRFCPYCSYQLGRDVQLQFVPVFDDGNWFFMTGSYRGSLGLAKSADAYDWLLHWDLYKTALNGMIKDHLIRGYYLVEELAVNSIYQVSVLPHTHAIIDSDDLDAEMVLEAVEAVKTAPEVNQAQLLEPDVVVDPITNQLSFMDRIRYLFKPINFVRAYENDWFNRCSTDPKDAQILNSHTTDLVLGYSLVNRGRNKMTAKGTLNNKCKRHIGKARDQRHRFKPLLKQLQCQSRYVDQPERDKDVALN